MTIGDQETSIADTQPIKTVTRKLEGVETSVAWLDEFDNHILTPVERVNSRREQAKAIVENENYGILKSTFVRTFPDLKEASTIVASMGATEVSTVPEFNSTSHEIMFCPNNASEWQKLSNKERQEKIQSEIIPKAKNIVYVLHGWDGEEGFFEPYAGILLSPIDKDAPETEQTAKEISVTPGIEIHGKAKSTEEAGQMTSDLTRQISSIPEDTLIISISYSGSMFGLNKDNVNEATESDVKTQILEAIEKINWEINEAKMKQIESEKYKKEKRELVKSVHSFLIDNPGYQADSPEFKLLESKLTEMVDEERLIAKGRYADFRTSLLIGHSMGGKRVSDIWLNAVVGEPMDETYAGSYRMYADSESKRRSDDFKTRVKKVNADLFTEKEFYTPRGVDENDRAGMNQYFDYIGGIRHASFLKKYSEKVYSQGDVRDVYNIAPTNLKLRYPALTVQSWMRVVFGPEFTHQIESGQIAMVYGLV